MDKTDNRDPGAKIELRRYFLKKYHAKGSAQVLDCCQGEGVLWSRLRRELKIKGYWGIDIKKKKGRLKLDSSRILAQPGWPQDVIDIDTYGSPWKHWEAMLPNVTRPTTVFLTLGQLTTGTVGRMSNDCLSAMGLAALKIPPAFHVKLRKIAVSYCLTRCYDYGLMVVEALEAVSSAGLNARYFGLRLKPKKAGGRADRPKHPHAEKEREHV